MKNQEQAEELVKVTGQVYLRPVLTDEQLNIPCVTSRHRQQPRPPTTTPTGTTAATSSQRLDGRDRRPSQRNQRSDDDGCRWTIASAQHGQHHATTVAAPTTTTVPTATPTTHGPRWRHDDDGRRRHDAHLARRPAGSDPGYVKARGGSFCKVGPAGGTGEVFQDDATARILSGSGWGVTVSLRGGSNGEGVWNVLASECYNATDHVPDPPAGDRARRRGHLGPDGATAQLHRQRADHRQLQRIRGRATSPEC